jgi:hypothetical protein
MTEQAPQYLPQTVEVDPQELIKLYNHAKGMVKLLGSALGRDVYIVERTADNDRCVYAWEDGEEVL